ncbi:MAG: ATP phosphoribosyltransferase [Flavobacteriales bacterium]|nr:ATP phosphoribosyltransferase [Flavobacteriales bacterium]MCB9449775.1 ATP phosphoribosyltransferase [Flavobacteriales bacterium]
MKPIRLAIQKSGRLSEDSLKLLKECGIKINTHSGILKADAANFPLELLFLRDDDIPGYVEDGVADAGIVGENVVAELGSSVDTAERLGFGKCRLSVAVGRNDAYNGIGDLKGKKIATSYPNILGGFLKKNNVEAEIHEISGSVEIAPGIGLADAICDLVSTGSTLMSNGLREAEVIFRSEALLVARKDLSDEARSILESLLFRIRSVQKASSNKYILLNAPNDSLETILNILPGMKSPTILPLAEEGWSSVHSVVNEDKFWEIIEQLRGAGAQGILVVPIEKMIL